MLFRRAQTNPQAASDSARKQSAPPLITDEADRAIFGVQLRYGMLSFAVAIFSVVALAIINAKYPTNPIVHKIVRNNVLVFAVGCLWFIPFLIGQKKQAAMRLQFARRYVAQQRWTTVVAALRAFTDWGQRSFDGDGEGHYLLAQAYDRTNRKDQARKAREFIRKHRSSSVWAKKLGYAPTVPSKAAAPVTRAKQAPSGSGAASANIVAAPKRAERGGQPLSKSTRRRRF